jgi:hypothetical protein
VHIPATLRREAYEPKPVIAYNSDAPAPPGGLFGKAKPERRFRKPRPLTQAQRRELGLLSEPDPPVPATAPTPRARRAPKRPQVTSGGGGLTGLAAAAVMAIQVADALKPARIHRAPAVPRGDPVDAISQAVRTPPSQPLPASQFPRRAAMSPPPRAVTTIAVLSCGHKTRLNGPPSGWIGLGVQCPECRHHVNVVALPQIGWQL